eukprot:2589794-Rhodomonas_salina.1
MKLERRASPEVRITTSGCGDPARDPAPTKPVTKPIPNPVANPAVSDPLLAKAVTRFEGGVRKGLQCLKCLSLPAVHMRASRAPSVTSDDCTPAHNE